MANITVVTSRTRSGKEIKVAVIPADLIGGRYDGLVFCGVGVSADAIERFARSMGAA